MNDVPELRALTSARGIAAWIVVLFHIRLSIADLPPVALAVFAKGYLAVDFFFLLSGFVIWLSWGERLRAGRLAGTPAFLLKRVARVWPLHLFMLACAVALATALAASGRADAYEFPWAELPLHVLLLQNWGWGGHLAWNDPAWSISCELAAYLLFPLLALAIDWRRWPSGAIVAVLAMLFTLLHAAMWQAGAASLGTDIPRFGVLRCLIEFTAGGAVCALWLRWRGRPLWPALGTSATALLCIAAWARGLPETLAVPAAFAAVLLALALSSGAPRNPLRVGPLHYLGEISYATYLSHFLLFYVFKLAMVDQADAIPPVLVALFLAMVLAGSIALYHLVERPAQAWVTARGSRLAR